jgi:hypothetical protein
MIWWGIAVVITLIVDFIIIKSELNEANEMQENEIKTRNDDGY